MKKEFKKYKFGGDVTLQVLSYTDDVMAAKLWFTGPGFDSTHHHVNEEVNTIISGRFEATNGSEKIILTAGDILHVHSDQQHNLECLTPTGEIVACWYPARKDIIEKFTETEEK